MSHLCESTALCALPTTRKLIASVNAIVHNSPNLLSLIVILAFVIDQGFRLRK